MNNKIDLKQTIEESFKNYAGAVILDRAICDVRDMLKPSARMLMYSQYKINNLSSKSFVKSAKVVGHTLGNYFTHGESSCYGNYMRMAKSFALRYPLEECQGNSGTIIMTGDEAASRYTEIRLSNLGEQLFNDIKKNSIEKWIPNFDETDEYPSVLPTIGFYNIVNGTTGIGVSIASSIPQFSIKEVNEAIIKLIQNENISFDEIYCPPDFATGGILINEKEVKESIRIGCGKSCKLRAKIEYNESEHSLKVTEVPYSVYTSTITKRIHQLIDENPDYGIDSIHDGSSKNANLTIYLSKTANPQRMISKLYRDTSLENHFGINMTMLDQGRFPKVFGWKEALQAHIDHIRICKRRELEFDLRKLEARQHILNGLIICVANIDECVKIIRSAESAPDASAALQIRFKIDEIQAKAILDLKLQRLVNIESIKLQSELEEIVARVSEISHILNEPSEIDKLLIFALEEVAQKFGDERRTKIMNLQEVETETEEEIIAAEDIAIFTLSNDTIMLVPSGSLQGAGRGKKGTAFKLPKGAIITDTLYTTSISSISIITNVGKIYSLSMRDLKVGETYSIYDLLKFQNGEQIVKVIDYDQFDLNRYILFVTKEGLIKKSLSSEYKVIARRGAAALKLKETDGVVNCFLSNNENDKIIIVSNSGSYVMYNHSTIGSIGRTAQGIKAIKLKDDEYVTAATILKDSLEYIGILSISNAGKGKITALENFTETSRAVRGNSIQKLDTNDSIIAAEAILENKTELHIVSDNKIVSFKTEEIPTQGRITSGVKIININGIKTSLHIIQGGDSSK